MHKVYIPPFSIISFDTGKMPVWRSETYGLDLHNTNLNYRRSLKVQTNIFHLSKRRLPNLNTQFIFG